MDLKTAAALGVGAALGAGVVYLLCVSPKQTSLPAAPECQGTARSTTASASPCPPPSSNSAHGCVQRFWEDEIISEQLTRNVQFFGEEGQKLVSGAFVVVVGLGGVGSHAAHMLLRSGVGKIRLIDFDQVTLSSLNRHAVATREDVGMPKAVCLEKHFKRIMPEADIECVVEMYTADKEEQLLGGSPDFVFDAIDNIDTKVALLAACQRRGLDVLCSAGAGAKADPTRMRFCDVSEAAADPLGRAVKTKLKLQYGITGGITVLLSTEKPTCKLVPVPDPDANPLDYQIVPNFRVRTIPVLGTTPAAFGMAAAGYILCRLSGRPPLQSEPIFMLNGKQYGEQLELLREREGERWGDKCPPCPLDLDDVTYMLRELWRGMSATNMKQEVYPGAQKGLMRSTNNLVFTRWDASKIATVDNMVLLNVEEADEHDATTLEEVKKNKPEFYKYVESMLDCARRQHYY